MSTYRIRVTDDHAASRNRPTFVARVNQWDGRWRTQDAREARTFKTERGAKRWIAERPDVVGHVEVLP